MVTSSSQFVKEMKEVKAYSTPLKRGPLKCKYFFKLHLLYFKNFNDMKKTPALETETLPAIIT